MTETHPDGEPVAEAAASDAWDDLPEEPAEEAEAAPWAWSPAPAMAETHADGEPVAEAAIPNDWRDEEPDDVATQVTQVHGLWPTPVSSAEPLPEARDASPPGHAEPGDVMAAIDADSEESTDDPWAAFIAARRESDGPVPFASPVAANPGAASHWTTNVAPADENHKEQPDEGREDDPWSAVAAASGYDESGADVGVYRGRQYRNSGEVPVPSPPTDPAAVVRPPTMAPPSSSARDDAHRSRPADAAWDFANDQDIVLRAFEAHASSTVEEKRSLRQTPTDEQDGGFSELLGRDAADLVDEVSERPSVGFLTSRGIAPQQSPSGEGSLTWMPPTAPTGGRPGFENEDEWGPEEDGGGEPRPPWETEAGYDGSGDDAGGIAGDRSRGRTLVRELVETGLLALLVFLAVRASFQNFKVDGTSMYPTLQNGQFLIVNKLVYSQVDLEKLSRYLPFVEPGDTPKRDVFHGPERGDIVVLKDPKRPDTDLIKRVIGLPGEALEIVQGKVYINGRYLEEPYIKSPWHFDKPKQVIPPGEYFVMGDNRDNSLDSRSPQVGLVPREMIIGKAMLSYWPLSEFGLAPNATPKLEEKPTLTTLRLDPAAAR
ncbi:MAG: signal peptidase I [Dehalococcoidia bacterium]|nr:signal peptidase I [Dehalococcoidia bacterium]